MWHLLIINYSNDNIKSVLRMKKVPFERMFISCVLLWSTHQYCLTNWYLNCLYIYEITSAVYHSIRVPIHGSFSRLCNGLVYMAARMVKTTLTLEKLGICVQNIVLFSNAVIFLHETCPIQLIFSLRCRYWWPGVWCINTSASVATVMDMHPCVFRCLWVNHDFFPDIFDYQ